MKFDYNKAMFCRSYMQLLFWIYTQYYQKPISYIVKCFFQTVYKFTNDHENILSTDCKLMIATKFLKNYVIMTKFLKNYVRCHVRKTAVVVTDIKE